MKKSNPNPLYEPQREKAGPVTYKKYAYQYNWGLYKIINQHIDYPEYAIFIELHEDVVFVDSLDSKKAKFSFCQVKTTKGRFNKNNLTKLKKGSSVLGKLLDSCLNKKYSKSINEINLISVNGFDIKLKKPKLTKEKIKISDVEKGTYDEIEKKIKSEISCSKLPSNIYFVVPELPEKKFQETIIGQISTLINSLFPLSSCNSVDIYRSLIDELNRKGTNTFDYEKWDDAIEKKSLTSITVTEVINTFTQHKNDQILNTEFNEISKELGLNTIKKTNLKRAFNRYKIKKTGQKSSLQLKTSKTIKDLIIKHIDDCDEEIAKLITLVSSELPVNISKKFQNETDLKGAIILEYILIQDEE